MASLQFHVHNNFGPEIIRKLAAASSKAEHIVALQVQKDTEPFVPALNKHLANDTKVVGGYIIYPGPYARFLYYGKLMIDPNTGNAWAPKGASKIVTGKDLQFNHAVHSQAQSHWFEASKAQNIDKWVSVAQKAVKNDL